VYLVFGRLTYLQRVLFSPIIEKVAFEV